MKSDLPVTFDQAAEILPIELKKVGPKKPTPRDRKAAISAQAFAKFGVQVLRVKARVLSALGREAEKCGIKQIGHGRILLASDNAEAAIAKLAEITDGLMKEENPDYELVVEVMRLQKEFNSQLLKTAEAHFNADKQPSFVPPAPPGITMPLPPGAAVMIGVGKPSGT